MIFFHQKWCGSSALVISMMAMGVSTSAHSAFVQMDEPLLPLPNNLKFDEKKVELGKKLFRDPRFSKDNKVACISCHSFQHGGADPRPFSIGSGGVQHIYNSPSVFNSSLNFRQQWTGGATTLEDLVDLVVKSPRVFNSNWNDIVEKLSKDDSLKRDFKAIYPAGLTQKNVSDALVVYQQSLITPSRFDRYLRGDAAAITANEKRGYERFKGYGCVGCHQGVNVGGNMFQKFGAMKDYFKVRAAAGKPITDADKGRFNITKKDDDMFIFKVPSLRNVALTAPYFHDASAQTLEEAVDIMFRFQLGRTAPQEDKALIVEFLKSLNGEIKE